MLDGIKAGIGYRKLKKEMAGQNRKAHICNLAQATSIAVIYRAEDEKMHQVVKNYLKYLKEEEGIRRLMAFSYFDGKDTPAYLQSILEYDYFTRKDLNWHGKPSGSSVDKFINEPYDILIDLTEEPCLPLRYVLVESKAKFKVGQHNPKNEPYFDLLIDTQMNDLAKFIEQVTYYLAVLNSGQGAA